MCSTTVTKALCDPSATFVGTLEHRFELAPKPFGHAGTRVAQRCLLLRDGPGRRRERRHCYRGGKPRPTPPPS
ncbi:hypothetical protein AB870_26490 (plasmid) [Pandoraea faecigallinarum]|uniref:Uncharacterized protein n=1 Tax=Pandoraea faecigallinarum TaxID=656179 RepID=A0A1D8X6G9_9BURK|nr:hypothetical protein AB870_26490 [Pandoraea faecigallinarum]